MSAASTRIRVWTTRHFRRNSSNDRSRFRAVYFLHDNRSSYYSIERLGTGRFGAGVAAVYGLIVASRGVFTLFFALSVVCAFRGAFLYLAVLARGRQRTEAAGTFPQVKAIIFSHNRKPMNESIAIVGMACIYPDARSPIELWQNVLAQRRAFRCLPAERLRCNDYYDADRQAPDCTLLRYRPR